MKVLGDVEPRVLAVTPLRNRELSMTAYSAVSFDLSLSRPHLHGAPVPEAAKTGQCGQDISGLQASGLGVADADATYEVACLPGLSHLQVSGTADYTMDPGMLPAGMGSRLESSHKWLSEPTILEDTAAFDSRSPAIDEHTIDSTPLKEGYLAPPLRIASHTPWTQSQLAGITEQSTPTSGDCSGSGQASIPEALYFFEASLLRQPPPPPLLSPPPGAGVAFTGTKTSTATGARCAESPWCLLGDTPVCSLRCAERGSQRPCAPNLSRNSTGDLATCDSDQNQNLVNSVMCDLADALTVFGSEPTGATDMIANSHGPHQTVSLDKDWLRMNDHTIPLHNGSLETVSTEHQGPDTGKCIDAKLLPTRHNAAVVPRIRTAEDSEHTANYTIPLCQANHSIVDLGKIATIRGREGDEENKTLLHDDDAHNTTPEPSPPFGHGISVRAAQEQFHVNSQDPAHVQKSHLSDSKSDTCTTSDRIPLQQTQERLAVDQTQLSHTSGVGCAKSMSLWRLAKKTGSRLFRSGASSKSSSQSRGASAWVLSV